MSKIALLPGRGVVEVAGEDRVGFLQGLVSNDVAQAAPGRAVWAALLTPQGKWFADFFILAEGERLLLDVERAQAAEVARRLARFRLRAKVTVRDVSAEWTVAVAWGGAPVVPAGAVVAPDPRLAEAGWRILAVSAPVANAGEAEWQAHRVALGLPDGSADLESEKSVLLEAGFDELNGVSWSKGCYMGQELTARTKYRGLVKRRLVPVAISGAATPGMPVMAGDAEVGTLRSVAGARGLATLRLEALSRDDLAAGEARLTPAVPAWLRLAGSVEP